MFWLGMGVGIVGFAIGTVIGRWIVKRYSNFFLGGSMFWIGVGVGMIVLVIVTVIAWLIISRHSNFF